MLLKCKVIKDVDDHKKAWEGLDLTYVKIYDCLHNLHNNAYTYAVFKKNVFNDSIKVCVLKTGSTTSMVVLPTPHEFVDIPTGYKIIEVPNDNLVNV